MIAAGTTALFPYIAEPVLAARRAGSLTVEVNPGATVLSPIVEFALRGPAGAWLPRIRDALGAPGPDT
jgi:NAD-dependent deacetylase